MLWNKISVDDEIILFKPLYLKIEKNVKLNIKVEENTNTKLVIISNCNYEINIDLARNTSLVVNSLNKDNSIKVKVNLLNKACITYNHSLVSKIDSVNNFIVNHLENDSISNLNNNGVNLSSNKLFFNIDGVINKKLSNIICNQSSKIINFDMGNSKIIPNLIINSNDIIANHSAYIGEINEEEKFYMQSRGINELDIKNIIYKATLLNKMDLMEEKKDFNKVINEWW